ncbi:polysaccharide deacetylase family protein [Paenibacillus sp. GCM10027626]|uniref:polysaccharide deacetylase family protein n=1 Tax=Paenibacillus sp. GCM10027626 TaxID=3273411 RepID=UPI00362B0610
MISTAQALGYREDERLLIINADDFGLCYSSNEGIRQLLLEGAVSSATIMMPCNWARDAALWSARHRHLDIGVHLTFTSEWGAMKWGPVCRHQAVGSLVTDEGYFPADAKTFERQAVEAEVKAELAAQIEMALSLGIDVTHVDNHMGSLYGLKTGRHFLHEVFEVCVEYQLPFRLPRQLVAQNIATAHTELSVQAQRFAEEAERRGIVVLDNLQGLPFQGEAGERYEDFKKEMLELIRNLQPGVTEIIIHPALATEELRAFHGAPRRREMEMELFRDEEVKQAIADEGIIPVRWRELRELQRRRGGM